MFFSFYPSVFNNRLMQYSFVWVSLELLFSGLKVVSESSKAIFLKSVQYTQFFLLLLFLQQRGPFKFKQIKKSQKNLLQAT